MKIQQCNNIQPSFNRRYYMLNSETMYLMAEKLDLNLKDLYQRTSSLNSKQQNFLTKLVDKYNNMYYYSKNKENPQNVFNIVQMIEKPKQFHYDIINKVSGTFENLSNILNSISNKKDAAFAVIFNNKIFQNKQHAENILADILQSPNKEEYINHIDNYKSYLRLNAENKDAIKILDKKIAEGSYDRKNYDKQRNLNHILKNKFVQNLDINDELEKYYSTSGIDFIDKLDKGYYLPSKYSEADKINLLEIYKTCNDDNFYMRDKIMQCYQPYIYDSDKFSKEIAAMLEIFKKIDKGDKYTTKFIDKFISNSNNLESAQALNEILETVPADKAYVFYNNLLTIIEFTKQGEERINALKNELTNFRFKNKRSTENYKLRKHAEKYGFVEKQSKLSKRIDYLKNELNKLRYYLIQKLKNNVPAQTLKSDTITPESAKTFDTTKIESVKIAENKQQQSANVSALKEEITKKQYVTPSIVPADTVFTKIQKQKIEAQEGARQFIYKHLHPSIVNEQEKIYVNKATKMRLKIMPEILLSIKETRADLRKKGVKRPKISNFDAVDLYTRINGNNKKLVNYMLKKRNTDGTRIFNVIDIMGELGKVHKRIIQERLKPAQARVLYEDVLQSKVNEFGKLNGKKN